MTALAATHSACGALPRHRPCCAGGRGGLGARPFPARQVRRVVQANARPRLGQVAFAWRPGNVTRRRARARRPCHAPHAARACASRPPATHSPYFADCPCAVLVPRASARRAPRRRAQERGCARARPACNGRTSTVHLHLRASAPACHSQSINSRSNEMVLRKRDGLPIHPCARRDGKRGNCQPRRGEARKGDAVPMRSDARQGKASHGEAKQGRTRGEATRGRERQGEARREKAGKGEAWGGGASPSEARRLVCIVADLCPTRPGQTLLRAR